MAATRDQAIKRGWKVGHASVFNLSAAIFLVSLVSCRLSKKQTATDKVAELATIANERKPAWLRYVVRTTSIHASVNNTMAAIETYSNQMHSLSTVATGNVHGGSRRVSLKTNKPQPIARAVRFRSQSQSPFLAVFFEAFVTVFLTAFFATFFFGGNNHFRTCSATSSSRSSPTR